MTSNPQPTAHGNDFAAPGTAESGGAIVTLGTVVALFAWGMAINLVYAGRGFMPLDQAVVFDGGWRTLCGQIPFRDYTSMTGVVPSLLQAVFFKLFGVTWFAYCLHASVFNGAFCVMVYALLRVLGVRPVLAVPCGLLSGISFYPPSGTPYLETHAFFFVLAAVLLAVAGGATERPWIRRTLWTALPFMIPLAFFSKQNVLLFALPALLIACLLATSGGKRMREFLRCMMAGAAICLAGLVAAASFWAISVDRLWSDLFVQSAVSGHRRLTVYGPDALAVLFRRRPALVSAVAVLGLLFVIQVAVGLRYVARRRMALELALAGSFMMLSALFVLTTKNDIVGGLPYCLLAGGIVLHRLDFFARSRWSRLTCGALILSMALAAARWFWVSVEDRSYHDVRFDPLIATSPHTPELGFMRFQAPVRLAGFEAEDLDRAIVYLRQQPGNFFLLGDSSILYGLARKPSVNPQLYFHAGMRHTFFETHRLASYQDELLANLERYRVCMIVVEGEQTWTGVTLDTFPRLRDWIRARNPRTIDLGWFHVIHVN